MSYCDLQQDCALVKQLTLTLDITSKQYNTLLNKYVELLTAIKTNDDNYEKFRKELENKLEELRHNHT